MGVIVRLGGHENVATCKPLTKPVNCYVVIVRKGRRISLKVGVSGCVVLLYFSCLFDDVEGKDWTLRVQ